MCSDSKSLARIILVLKCWLEYNVGKIVSQTLAFGFTSVHAACVLLH